MKLVEVAQLPKVEDIVDVPLDDLVSIYKTCKEMEKVCRESKGIGLSAVQVGIPWRLFLIGREEGGKYTFEYFLNCNYTPVGVEKVLSTEGCLTLPDETGGFRTFVVERYDKVLVEGFQLLESGGVRIVPFKRLVRSANQGVIFQHELDHQLGEAGLISRTGKEIVAW